MRGDTFLPEELELLCRVFEHCKNCSDSEADREIRATRIISMYRAGVIDEAKLIEACRKDGGAEQRWP
jgi:hypothetical protein